MPLGSRPSAPCVGLSLLSRVAPAGSPWGGRTPWLSVDVANADTHAAEQALVAGGRPLSPRSSRAGLARCFWS